MKRIALLAAFLALAGPARADDLSAAPRFGGWGFDFSGQDPATRPGDDFFRYANGGYLDRTEIPPDRTRFGAFDALRQLSEQRVRAILEQAGDTRIGRYYRTYLDEAAIEARGTEALDIDLARISAAKSHEDVAVLMGDRDNFGRSLISIGISADEKNPDRYAVGVSSRGFGLPDRDYYLKESFAEVRGKYQAYIAQMLALASWPEADKHGADIIALETRFAEASWERAALRDREKTYNAMTVAELAALSAGFGIKAFLSAADLGVVDRFIVADTTAFPKKAAIFAETPVDVLKAWLAFNAIEASAAVLPARFVDAQFTFRNRTLGGQPELAPRWKRAVDATNAALGEDVGQEYVKRHFPVESKQQMLDLVGNLRIALRTRIEGLTWMTPATKEQALDKLVKFNVKIGYPDTWEDYTALVVNDGDAYGNLKRSRLFEWDRQVVRLDQPVDRTEWGMTPQTVNAYYNSTLNEIVFPAGILQPPFFDPKADPAINYGGIGGVIGHEMSHGFDDQGRKSDGDGRLTDWWTAEDAAKFNAQADMLGGQYETFEMLPGERINGKLTMGENIGDLGGLNTALTAYHASLAGKPAPLLDGTTGVQRVFLSWAQIWRTKQRTESLRQQLYTDSHSPAEARVNGIVRNMDAWYEAFDVQPGDKLYVAPEQRVRIW